MMMLKIEEEFGLELSLTNIYKEPTIFSIAKILEEKSAQLRKEEEYEVLNLLGEIENMKPEEVRIQLSDIK